MSSMNRNFTPDLDLQSLTHGLYIANVWFSAF
jgi:hypothetical protein